MDKRVPKNPVLLAVFLGKLITGDEKHQQDRPLPKDIRTELDEAKSKLDSLNSTVQVSKGQYLQTSQERRNYVTELQADRFRDAVYGRWGRKDQVLADYSLVVRRKAHRGTAGVPSPSAASKAEREKVHLAKMQAQLDKADARRTALAARITRQEAKVAKAAEVAPPASHPPEGDGGAATPVPSPETK